ncbi:NYN domain-containing protein [Pseudoflavonifractor sp. 524-17]|uniref:NYN domain-containing protein n=1 Tax=Pseudoflavonifractor sp. 524-17 TaxID=2304577 RepID=UPI00137A5C98|nr:NYN domain-containing protein [Pseudoflavonifractor sp. 524-17]NCE65900.1 NYN domain-containing protein [Pseudoflavonifractor sp. 524-17]
MERGDLRLAVLIDADNAPRTAIKDVMAEVAVYGTPTIKRIYGDWTSPNMASWKPLLLENAIAPIQQYAYTTGKNATDSAMIIDAMDVLYSGRVDGFVLVSSDSDFTRLATRLREAGMKVYGMGERKTPNPFIVACDKFVYIEVIRAAGERERAAAKAEREKREPEPAKSAARQPAKKKAPKKARQPEPEPKPAQPPESPAVPGAEQGVPPEVEELLADSLEAIADEDGYAFMGELGNFLLKKQPDFDPRNFGFSKLTKLFKALDRFEIDVRSTNLPHVKHIFVRDKNRK